MNMSLVMSKQLKQEQICIHYLGGAMPWHDCAGRSDRNSQWHRFDFAQHFFVPPELDHFSLCRLSQKLGKLK